MFYNRFPKQKKSSSFRVVVVSNWMIGIGNLYRFWTMNNNLLFLCLETHGTNRVYTILQRFHDERPRPDSTKRSIAAVYMNARIIKKKNTI